MVSMDIFSFFDSELQRCNLAAHRDVLIAFAQEIMRWNDVHNLTSLKTTPQILLELFVDSLQLVPYCGGGNCLDIGSGAGFPGLMLALALPKLQVTLLESRRKRVSFQQHACRILELKNVHSVWGRAGEHSLAEIKFATVTCKAFASLDNAFNLCQRYLHPNGVILLPRGEKDLLSQAIFAPSWHITYHQYCLPNLAKARFIVEARRA
jgi:16S rRNA (guanine527-N7)-methyltransferase